MFADTDIDIDFSIAGRDVARESLTHIKAIQKIKDTTKLHPSGTYFQAIPVDETGVASIDYETAQTLGYVKVDFLPNSIYDGVRDEDHLEELMNREPLWDTLELDGFVENVYQIGNHKNIIRKIKPRNVEDLALVLALIRPGKRYLLEHDRTTIERDIWKPVPGEYVYKKAHAIAYAVSLVVQINMLCDRLMQGEDISQRYAG